MEGTEAFLATKYASCLAIRDLQVELIRAELQELRKTDDALWDAWACRLLQRIDKIADDFALQAQEHRRR